MSRRQAFRKLFGHKEAFTAIAVTLLAAGSIGGIWPAFIVFLFLSIAYVVTA